MGSWPAAPKSQTSAMSLHTEANREERGSCHIRVQRNRPRLTSRCTACWITGPSRGSPLPTRDLPECHTAPQHYHASGPLSLVQGLLWRVYESRAGSGTTSF
ncbi:Hypothetical predicted protein [Pelobates cultripes]|uniref:Uncharacterized protein n=1 Tax=Pelobates cultripes TaxID=61616 RepID=A0AAD1VVY2_PELCU|nr:Hypothetical predicted protein [Pelobates cultripes]